MTLGRKWGYSGLAALTCLSVAIVVCRTVARRPPPPPFVRLDVRALHDPGVLSVDTRSGEIEWRDGNRRERQTAFPGIHGAGFAVDGERQFPFSPPFSGACGFFCLYEFRADGDKAMSMDLLLVRGQRRSVVGRTVAAWGNGYFIQKVALKKGDRLELRWRGQGRVFLGRPLLYRVLPPQQRRTVVLVAADCLRADQVDARIGDLAVAPFMSAYRRECASFDRCLAPSTWTLPSFASLFTARGEWLHGLNQPGVLAADQPFLIEDMAASFITLNYNGGVWLNFQLGFHRGFDVVRSGGYYGDRTHGARQVLGDALAMLRRAEFPATLLFLHTYQLHSPYQPPLEEVRRLDPDNPVLAGGPFPYDRPAMSRDARKRTHYFRLYQAGVSAFDSALAHFVAELKRAGLYGGTMLALFGDHGEEFAERGHWEHGSSLDREQLEIPLLIRFPDGSYAGRRVGEPVSLFDLLPTLCDREGISLPAVPLDGVSLLPLLRGQGGRPQPVVSSLLRFWNHPEIPLQLAVSFPAWKVVATFRGGPAPAEQIQVYDVSRDPGERHSLPRPTPAVWREAWPVIRGIRDGLKGRAATGAQPAGSRLTPEMRDQLKTLGYL